MSDLQAELLKAGLISQDQYDRQKVQDERREAKDRQKVVKATDSTGSFHSLADFMSHIKRELRKDPMASTIKKLTRQAHQVVDQLQLKDKKRKRMHAFLAKVAEGLAGRQLHEREAFIDDVFLKQDPKLVSEE